LFDYLNLVTADYLEFGYWDLIYCGVMIDGCNSLDQNGR
jgi:hypothetical protein